MQSGVCVIISWVGGMELDGSDDTATLIKKDNEELLGKTPKVGVPQMTTPRMPVVFRRAGPHRYRNSTTGALPRAGCMFSELTSYCLLAFSIYL
jgi:hypothetical protein